jgi:hypothetical protein
MEDAVALFRICQRAMDVMRCEVVEECERRPRCWCARDYL